VEVFPGNVFEPLMGFDVFGVVGVDVAAGVVLIAVGGG